jgi:predicted dehydrogenase
MKRTLRLFGAVLCGTLAAHGAQSPVRPLRLAVVGLSHGHAGGLFARLPRPGIELVGVYEPDRAVADRYAKQYGVATSLFYTDLGTMLDAVKPEAVAAFGPTSEHLRVVEACAPRGVHVMVEKPLALTADEALRMQALAARFHVHVLTNYETTWYPSTEAVGEMTRDRRTLGPIRKIVVRDGHQGPKEIGVQDEFLDWLTDPARNGGGALMDFGCYGANLATWLMGNAEPNSVTAVTLHVKPDVYPRVEDEATIVLTYPGAQAIIEASWNWPFGRKDMDVYGTTGYVRAPDARTLRVRAAGETDERLVSLDPRHEPTDDPLSYFAALVRGDVPVADGDLSSLANNVVVMKILDAARLSAKTGRTVRLDGRGRARTRLRR